MKISLLKLFWIFFKIGSVAFGGGYAMLPFLKSEIVEKEKICTLEDITNYYALSQCLPGLVAGNVSALVGYKVNGIKGAFAAVLGTCLPAFLSIVIIYTFITQIINIPLVQEVFYVLEIAVCILIALTIIELWKPAIVDKYTTIILLFSIIATTLNISPFIIVIAAGLSGILKNLICTKSKNKERETSNE